MTSDTLPTGPVAAGPTVLRPAPAGLALLAWPALDASGADAAVTARSGGVSSGPYATLNLSLSVGDDPGCVRENRHRLAAGFGASLEDFVFARQVHGAGVAVVAEADRGSGTQSLDDAIGGADALVTTSPGVMLAILTADCVPIVLHDPVAGVLACVHAGWRGTVAGVTAATLAAPATLAAAILEKLIEELFHRRTGRQIGHVGEVRIDLLRGRDIDDGIDYLFGDIGDAVRSAGQGGP